MSDSHANPAADARQCLVLCRTGPTARAAAERAIAARGWHAAFEHDPHLAMASLCLLQRGNASRSASSPAACEGATLVVCEPSDWPEFAALADAVAARLPAVAVWSFAGGALRELTPGSGGAMTREPNAARDANAKHASQAFVGEKVARSADRSAGAPRLRLTEPMSGDATAPDAPAVHDEEAATDEASEVGSARVTQQELDMLFQQPQAPPASPPPPPLREGHA
jgi:hypothetical protein